MHQNVSGQNPHNLPHSALPSFHPHSSPFPIVPPTHLLSTGTLKLTLNLTAYSLIALQITGFDCCANAIVCCPFPSTFTRHSTSSALGSFIPFDTSCDGDFANCSPANLLP